MRYFLLLLFPLIVSSCGKDDIILFEMEYTEDFEIQAGLNSFETHHFLIKDISTNYNNLLQTFDQTDSQVSNINPQNARLDALFSSATYDIIREISVRIYKDDVTNYKEIFYIENVPLNTGGDLNLIPTLVDVRDILSGDSFNIDIAIQFRQAPAQFIESRFIFDFLVK